MGIFNARFSKIYQNGASSMRPIKVLFEQLCCEVYVAVGGQSSIGHIYMGDTVSLMNSLKERIGERTLEL